MTLSRANFAALLPCLVCFSATAVAQSNWSSTLPVTSEAGSPVRMLALDGQRVLVHDYDGLALVLDQQLQVEGAAQLGQTSYGAGPLRTADGG